jgi:CRP-like cAMP-binding protein
MLCAVPGRTNSTEHPWAESLGPSDPARPARQPEILQDGDVVLQAGDEPGSACIVRSGRLVAEDRSGRLVPLSPEERVFGFAEMLGGGRPRRTVRALGGVQLYRIARADLVRLFGSARQRRALLQHSARARARCSLERRGAACDRWATLAAAAAAAAAQLDGGGDAGGESDAGGPGAGASSRVVEALLAGLSA